MDGAAVRVSLVCFTKSSRPSAPSPHPEEPAKAGVSKEVGAAVLNASPAPRPFETRPAGAPQGEGDLGTRLDGKAVEAIHADLTASDADMTRAKPMRENTSVAFMGDTKGGAFDIEGKHARAWLAESLNANGKPNSDVLKPWINGLDLTRRPRDMWIFDFGWTMSEAEAALYEAPFAHVLENVKPDRDGNRRDAYRIHWWRHVEARPAMWSALLSLHSRHGRARPGHPRRSEAHDDGGARHEAGHDALLDSGRYIATPRVSKHRLFGFVDAKTCSDSATIAIARDDETTFGILHSRFHEAWSLRLGTWLGVGNDPRYTTHHLRNLPLPRRPDAQHSRRRLRRRPARHPHRRRREGARRQAPRLAQPARSRRYRPRDHSHRRAGRVAGALSDRILPKNAEAAVKLKERTLTNLYNQRPRWLSQAHDALDRAVAAAYGWPEDIATDDALAKLLALNLERSAAQHSG